MTAIFLRFSFFKKKKKFSYVLTEEKKKKKELPANYPIEAREWNMMSGLRFFLVC